ncbi:hypothetical protein RRG08_012451 [Elysia crispata]|uniref:Uncharacterized protein n=1 Tax=Elysia crispata TaxID=231223 RepID=A0AAE1B4D5_9GAST|nr:hypothetical protein RRG08_012451 [Elysia crispata]
MSHEINLFPVSTIFTETEVRLTPQMNFIFSTRRGNISNVPGREPNDTEDKRPSLPVFSEAPKTSGGYTEGYSPPAFPFGHNNRTHTQAGLSHSQVPSGLSSLHSFLSRPPPPPPPSVHKDRPNNGRAEPRRSHTQGLDEAGPSICRDQRKVVVLSTLMESHKLINSSRFPTSDGGALS